MVRKSLTLSLFISGMLCMPVSALVFAAPASKPKPKAAVSSKTKRKPLPAKTVQRPIKKKSTAQKPSIRKSPAQPARVATAEDKLETLKRRYRYGEISAATLWTELQDFEGARVPLSRAGQGNLLNAQSGLVMQAGYPYLAAFYAIEAIKKADTPFDQSTKSEWSLLWQASQKKPMQSILDAFASSLKEPRGVVPGFGNSWFYYLGNAEQNRGNGTAAVEHYARLRINDYHFLSAKYQTAMIHLDSDRAGPAELALKTMLNSVSQTLAPVPDPALKELSNYAKLALARLYYQQSEFVNAIKFYRAVDRDSRLFYDALFEQSWAFFMAGYPNHSLGALHGVESPFFRDVFNPEASVLRAMVYYWMCRYEDSRGALADFSTRHADSVESLENFLERKRLSEDTAYQLFEDYVSGVSADSLGIPRAVLESAASEDAMMLLRDQYAGIVTELDRLESVGVFGSRSTGRAAEILRRQLKDFRKTIGEQYIVELQGLKKHFERLYEQSQFLYVELLMSEKEQLLGRELHASSKIDRVSQRKNIAGWGNKVQAWKDNRLNEFWWDEVGFYIYGVQPLCKSSAH